MSELKIYMSTETKLENARSSTLECGGEELAAPASHSTPTTSTNVSVAVAMSGGVDSSTVAAMLRESGRSIVGLTMQLWNQRRLPKLQGDGPAPHRCCSIDDVYDARRVAEHFD
ncbi:MAG: asparagine synthase-related protein, partial [Terracidiphilus sp.]